MSRITKDLCGMLEPKRPKPLGRFVNLWVWLKRHPIPVRARFRSQTVCRSTAVHFDYETETDSILMIQGFGALHFLSRDEWLRAAGEAGFKLEREFSITPFVRVFLFRRPV